eukprot:CFRG3358T1
MERSTITYAGAAAAAGVFIGLPSPLSTNFVMSIASFLLCFHSIPQIQETFIKANRVGKDLNKRNSPVLPESVGVIVGAVYLVFMFCFIPFAFARHFSDPYHVNDFPHDKFSVFLAGLLSICCMILLGFTDDVFDLKWRYKLVLPTIASLPLLMVYYVGGMSTTIIPPFFRQYIGESMNIGYLYYLYMSMLAVFCTNAINIYAGVNGLEAGQSLVIGVGIAMNNVVQLNGDNHEQHLYSLYMMGPFIATTAALLYHNWFPASVFVGDTYCYFAGMTFAVVGILGTFSKTVLLFFIPQIANFLYSVPQLFRLIPCPRHRMPRINKETGLLEASKNVFLLSEIKAPGRVITRFILASGLARATSTPAGKDGDMQITMSNLTMINLCLDIFGPMQEDRLTAILLCLQVLGVALAFLIRYRLVFLFYEHN